jgi:hypothetical protein
MISTLMGTARIKNSFMVAVSWERLSISDARRFKGEKGFPSPSISQLIILHHNPSSESLRGQNLVNISSPSRPELFIHGNRLNGKVSFNEDKMTQKARNYLESSLKFIPREVKLKTASSSLNTRRQPLAAVNELMKTFESHKVNHQLIKLIKNFAVKLPFPVPATLK